MHWGTFGARRRALAATVRIVLILPGSPQRSRLTQALPLVGAPPHIGLPGQVRTSGDVIIVSSASSSRVPQLINGYTDGIASLASAFPAAHAFAHDKIFLITPF